MSYRKLEKNKPHEKWGGCMFMKLLLQKDMFYIMFSPAAKWVELSGSHKSYYLLIRMYHKCCQ